MKKSKVRDLTVLGLTAEQIKRLEYRFSDINKRCNNPKHQDSKYYSEKGVKNQFENTRKFILWYIVEALDMGLTIEEGLKLTVDRIDGAGNYHPSNCRLATRKEQSDNKSKTRTKRTKKVWG